MGDVIGGQAGNGDVEIDRVDAWPENTLFDPLLQQIVQGIDELMIHLADEFRSFDVFAAVEIFARQQFSVFGMLYPDRHQEMHELAHARLGIQLARQEVALALADGLIGCLERGREQAVFVADVMIEQGLVHARTPCDFVDARAVQPLEGEFGDGSLDDFLFGERRRAPHPLAGWFCGRSLHWAVSAGVRR